MNEQKDWVRQVWDIPAVGTAGWGRNMTLENTVTNPLASDVGAQGVKGGDPGVELRVTAGEPKGGAVKGAELASARRDMLFGSFRAGMKYTGQSGTCGAFFFYYNDSQEIDFEFLSKLYQTPATKPADLLLVIHAGPEVDSSLLFRPTPVSFFPADGYHEYRFDWTPERVTFYADGKLLWETTAGVPFHAGGLTLNHWSNGDAGWSNGPPQRDAHMQFSYVKAYFNTTNSAADAKSKCRDPNDPKAVCKVPDQTTPPDPRQTTGFVSQNKGLPDNSPPPPVNPNPPPPPPPPPNPVTPPVNPSGPQKKVSPDNSCGGANGGANATYCEDPKCQPDFGFCGTTLPEEPESGNQAPSDAKKISPDASCGGAKGYTCLGSGHGDCCSSYGYCGSEMSYCGDPKCQKEFGRCGDGKADVKTG
ncbi:MAG: hypothetical protein Q9186_001089 [Xanthomendoza sp. 1 TL-2023]